MNGSASQVVLGECMRGLQVLEILAICHHAHPVALGAPVGFLKESACHNPRDKTD